MDKEEKDNLKLALKNELYHKKQMEYYRGEANIIKSLSKTTPKKKKG